MTALLENAAKQHAILITFLWPAPLGDDFGDLILEDDFSTATYTNWTEDINIDGVIYSSMPALGVQIGEFTGRFEDGDHVIEMPLLLADGTAAFPADTLTAQPAHAKVEVHVQEMMPGDSTTLRTLAFGHISKGRKGILGRSGQARMTFRGVKALLRGRQFGLAMTGRCPWRFGDANCKMEIVRPSQFGQSATFVDQEQGTISAIADHVITITGLSTLSVYGHWFMGWAQVAGLRLRIHSYTTGNVFGLGRRPPASWAGATVTLTPGCDKTPRRCNELGNLLNFGQPAMWMPTRFVQLEKQGPAEVQP